MQLPPFHESVLAEDGLYRKIQWEVENLMLSQWRDLPKKGEIILEMFDDI